MTKHPAPASRVVKRLSLTALVILGAFLISPISARLAFAHHSTAAFDNNTIALKGTIVEFDWGNPHIEVVFAVKGADGSVVQWSAQGASVESSLADGITKHSLNPGDAVIMTVKPAKSGAPVAIIARMQKSDGTDIGFSRRGAGATPARSGAASARKSDSESTN